jgi:signal transduction histidine kinase
MSQYIELLGSELNSEKYRGCFNDLNQAYQRLHLFSEKALLITQLDADAYAIRKEPVQIWPLICEQLDLMASVCREKSIRFTGLQDMNIQVAGDPRLFGVLFQSLIDNAIRYSPNGGLIRFEVKNSKGACAIEISDEGPGYPPEVLDYAFEPFSLGEDPVALKLGLSLSICYLIMKSHGGDMMLNNNASKGAVVQLVFNSFAGGSHVTDEKKDHYCRR